VQSIVDGSQAQEAGLQKGDIILEYGGTKISRAAELVKESKTRSPDEEVELLIIREGEQVRVNVKGGFIGVRIKTVNLPAEPAQAR
jgi:S1-C subfamily serine protease